MNKNEQNLDKIFRDKLEGHSVTPPFGSWENIQNGLKKNKRKGTIIFYRAIAVAAVVVAAIIGGWLLNNSSNQNVPLAENEIEKVTPANQDTTVDNVESQEQNENIPVSDLSENKTLIAEVDNNSQEINSENDIISRLSTESNVAVAVTKPRNNSRFNLIGSIKAFIKTGTTSEKLKSISEKEYNLIQNLSEKDKELIAFNSVNNNATDLDKNKWEVGLRVSPGYSSQNTSHSEYYSQNMTYSNSEGNTDITGGVSVEFKAAKHWSIESGIYYSQNGQQSGNSLQLFSTRENISFDKASVAADYFNTPVEIKQGKMSMNSSAGVIEFSQTPENAELSATLDSESNLSNTLLTNSQFSQVFDFIEIPVLLKYNLIDKKIAIDLIGGLSANWIIGNNVYMGEGNNKENIGKTADISKLNYSGTVGVGVDYALGKRLSVSVEPRVNYYLKSINKNEAINYKPYRIGIYTGINYNF
ncbi:MAG: outer membrane beta-barrel protein [Mariniphaga sp.]|nr:outer membrane beta-barrel protein [Mariniphaga sp.]